MDSVACNYEIEVTQDDGSCDYCSCQTEPSNYTLTVEASTPIVAPGTTYRFYVDMTNASDRMSAVFGNNESPLEINTPDGAFNSEINASWSASGINSDFIGFFPEMADDSYATIGLDAFAISPQEDPQLFEYEDPFSESDGLCCDPDGTNYDFITCFTSGCCGIYENNGCVEDPDCSNYNPNAGCLSTSPISAYFTTDGATSVLANTINGASYSISNTASNGLPDANMRVLVLQVTTTGSISGILNYEVFPLGVEADQVQITMAFDGVGTFGLEDTGGTTIACGCTDPTAFNYNASSEYDDDSCIPFITGCMNDLACNFDPEANTFGPCEFFSCLPFGCTDTGACNYDPTAEFNDGSCEYPEPLLNCDGTCEFDSDEDGICDSDEILGCPDLSACNYAPLATDSDGSCTYAEFGYDCQGICILDENDNGVCDFEEVYGCSIPIACNYNPETTIDDDSCEFVSCLVQGCVDVSACNFDDGAEIDDGTCEFASVGYDCFGVCINDSDGDEICDEFEVYGCTDPEALNYNPQSTEDDGLCEFNQGLPEEFNFTPTPYSGTVLGQATLDQVNCEGYDWIAAFDPQGNCAGYTQMYILEGTAYFALTIYGDEFFTYAIDEGLISGDYFTLQLFDGSQGDFHTYYDWLGNTEIEGWSNTNGTPIPGLDNADYIFDFKTGPFIATCLDPTGCNFNPASQTNDGCIYPEDGFDCDGNCLNDIDEDGICDENEVAGCMDETACDYNAAATDDDGSCSDEDECGICGGTGIPTTDCDCEGNQLDALGVCGGNCSADLDLDGVCDDVDDCIGSFDACGICNGPGAIYECGCEDIPEGDCDCEGNQLDALGVCNGDCMEDTDEDGICDDIDDCVGAFDACGICNGPGSIYECGCSEIPDGDCDCLGNQLDTLGVCGGDCTADLDADGVCDDIDECVGAFDACGVCNGEGAIYTCGCQEIPEGDCDCDGNQLDALGVCGGLCEGDDDGDGICNSDEISGCTDATACNFNLSATDEDGSCEIDDECGICGGNGIPETDCDCDGNQLDAVGICGGICETDGDEDGVCDSDEVLGCDDPAAYNFQEEATENDNSCNYISENPDTFDFIPSPISGTLYGNVEIEGEVATGLDWIAAFDEDGNCAGATSLIMYEGVAWVNLVIYGNDPTTPNVDEGMNTGENFTLVVYDESEGIYITYFNDLGNEFLDSWVNTNGAPMPAWSDPNQLIEFNLNIPCQGDYNLDGVIQLTDLLDFLSAYGTSCDGCGQDFNNDGVVQLSDLLDLLSLYGTLCP